VPTAGHDYPGSHGELLAWFPDDHACIDYLQWLRWPDGFRCPRCVSRAGWRLSSGRWEGAVCGRQTSVAAGTIFHRTRTPLPTWFAAAWLMTGQKQGVSALGLQRALGLGSYQTAWAMLHRFRLAMVRPARERLSGWVEVDEAYVGGVEGAVHGRETATKSIVAIAVEIKSPKGFGRIRLRSVPDVTRESLIPFIEAVVEPGSTVHTDGWQAYWTVPEVGVKQRKPIRALIDMIDEADWITLADYPEAGEAQIAETKHHGWRLIARRTRLVGKQAELFPNWQYFAFATNRTEPLLLIEAEHREHAVVELCIRDLKDQALAHFPSGQFAANGAWTVIAALAHNLGQWTSLIGLPHDSTRTATTRRNRLFRIPGRLTRTARQWTLRMPARWPWQQDFTDALTRIRALPALT
jgi:hypothetical protein